MEQFNDMYELESARYQTTADEIKPYKNITTKHTFHLNGKLSNGLNQKAITMNLIGHPQKMVLTKHQNKPKDRRVDIALYDTRNQYGLNAQNELGNYFTEQLDKKRIDNIILPHGPETLPLKKNSLKNESNNNYTTDERLERMKWTQERQYMNEGNRIRTAQLLRDSEMIKERNKRQEEANLAGKKHGFAQFGLGRLGSDNQFDKEYHNEPISERESFNRYRTKDDDLSLYHEDFTGIVPVYENDLDNPERYKIKENYTKDSDITKFDNNEKESLLYDYEYITKRGRHKQSKRKMELNKVADEFLRQFISDYDFLLEQHQKDIDNVIRNSQRKWNRDVFEEGDPSEEIRYQLETLERDKTIRLLKNKDIVQEYNNENIPNIVLDVKTSSGNVPMKLFATKAKEYLSLVRDDNIDFENTIDIVRIPIETLPKKIKNKVKKNKERTVSLNFDDWNDLLKISYTGRFEHERIRKEDIMRRLQDSEIQKRIDEGFDSNELTLTDSRTIQTLEEMKEQSLIQRTREQRLLKTERDFSNDEQTLSFDRTPSDDSIMEREERVRKQSYRRLPTIWKTMKT